MARNDWFLQFMGDVAWRWCGRKHRDDGAGCGEPAQWAWVSPSLEGGII